MLRVANQDATGHNLVGCMRIEERMNSEGLRGSATIFCGEEKLSLRPLSAASNELVLFRQGH
jgi:hypothetical protein